MMIAIKNQNHRHFIIVDMVSKVVGIRAHYFGNENEII